MKIIRFSELKKKKKNYFVWFVGCRKIRAKTLRRKIICRTNDSDHQKPFSISYSRCIQHNFYYTLLNFLYRKMFFFFRELFFPSKYMRNVNKNELAKWKMVEKVKNTNFKGFSYLILFI